MVSNGFLQISFYLLVILLCVKPLGLYMANIYEGKPCGLNRLLSPLERVIYYIARIDPLEQMSWKKYTISMLVLNCVVLITIYFFLRIQTFLPFNPQHFSVIDPTLAFNIAAGFIASADWQAYSGESTMSYFTQGMTLTFVKFVASATGMSILVAFIRGLARENENGLGNFWSDITRSILYILLPLSLVFAIILASQGVIQNFKPSQTANLIQPITYQQASETMKLSQQVIPMGPVASSLAIEQIGVNGGGFFNVNNAHPFENPTPLTNFLEILAIVLIPAAFCYTFGVMIRDKKQGWAVLIAMFIIFLPTQILSVMSEQTGNPAFTKMGIDLDQKHDLSPGGNMEGKETRFGIVNSAFYQTMATATASGSNNAMVDSFTPLGVLASLWLMHTGEIVFGGAGSGLYGMLILMILAVFIAGLMVGRAPEYLGKKIEPFEMKMASFIILIMPIAVLLLTAVAVLIKPGTDAVGNPGAHGFTEILYTFTSIVNTNGGSMAGLNANTPFYNIVGALAMLFGRYWVAIPTLAIAGSLVSKRKTPINSGTVPTHSLLFILLLVAISIIIGALTFFPALSLGPLVEHFMLWAQ